MSDVRWCSSRRWLAIEVHPSFLSVNQPLLSSLSVNLCLRTFFGGTSIQGQSVSKYASFSQPTTLSQLLFLDFRFERYRSNPCFLLVQICFFPQSTNHCCSQACQSAFFSGFSSVKYRSDSCFPLVTKWLLFVNLFPTVGHRSDHCRPLSLM